MSGDQIHTSPQSVEAFWYRFARAHGFDRGDGEPIHQLQPSERPLIANVSTGRWVADCPNCGGGVALWRENVRACCLTCGCVYSGIDWPDAAEMAEAEAILLARPPANQAWRRDIGETLDDLRRENEAAGLPVAA
jgi:hypothetical protein